MMAMGPVKSQRIVLQEPLKEPDTFGKCRDGDIFIHCMARSILRVGHAHGAKTQRRIRQGMEVPAIGAAHNEIGGHTY